MAEDPKELGKTIRQVRRERGLTLKQLGELAKTTGGNIQQIETGRTFPSIPLLYKIAGALELESVGELFFSEDLDEIRAFRELHKIYTDAHYAVSSLLPGKTLKPKEVLSEGEKIKVRMLADHLLHTLLTLSRYLKEQDVMASLPIKKSKEGRVAEAEIEVPILKELPQRDPRDIIAEYEGNVPPMPYSPELLEKMYKVEAKYIYTHAGWFMWRVRKSTFPTDYKDNDLVLCEPLLPLRNNFSVLAMLKEGTPVVGRYLSTPPNDVEYGNGGRLIMFGADTNEFQELTIELGKNVSWVCAISMLETPD